MLSTRRRQGVSIDVEPELIDLARHRLADIGYRPTLVAGDGARGMPENAPFDRIIATCAVPAIPWAWVEQTRLGGVILADVKIEGQHGSLVRLTRTDLGRAEGRFDPTYGSFMRLRHRPGPYRHSQRARLPEDAPVSARTTTTDPRTPFDRLVVWFLAGLRIGGGIALGYSGGDPRTSPRAVRLSTRDGSWCEIDLAADRGAARHLLREAGPTQIWAEVEHADRRWHDWNQPGWERFGATVTEHRQTVWLDDPDGPHRWVL